MPTSSSDRAQMIDVSLDAAKNCPKVSSWSPRRRSIRVAGVGETDYAALRRTLANRHADPVELAVCALRYALQDAGTSIDRIDGLATGEALRYSRTAEVLGMNPRWGCSGDVSSVLQAAVMAIDCGVVDRVALVHGSRHRTASAQYGGPRAQGRDKTLSYGYYAPYGFTSQGAIMAMMASRLLSLGVINEGDLWRVVNAQRSFAASNPRALLPTPISHDEYLASPFIAEPLRRADYCGIDDGGVAIILEAEDVAEANSGVPVAVRGFARVDVLAHVTTFEARFTDCFRQTLRTLAGALWSETGVASTDVGTAQLYDAFSVHVPMLLNGLGLCREQSVSEFLASGHHGPGGALPVNTAGGHLAEAYMQGWAHHVEAVRQARRARTPDGATIHTNALYSAVFGGMASAFLYGSAEPAQGTDDLLR